MTIPTGFFLSGIVAKRSKIVQQLDIPRKKDGVPQRDRPEICRSEVRTETDREELPQAEEAQSGARPMVIRERRTDKTNQPPYSVLASCALYATNRRLSSENTRPRCMSLVSGL